MSGLVRGLLVAVILGVATLGEGGASAGSLVIQHVLLAIGVAAAVFLRPPAPFVPSKAPSLGWLAFACCAAAGAIVAPYGYAAWLVLIEVAAFGSVAWLAAGDPAAWTRVLPPAVALFAGAHGAAAVVQRFAGTARPASTFLNPNHLAAWLSAATLLLAGSLTGTPASRRARWFSAASIVLALAGLFVAGSRGAALGLLAGSAVLAGATWPRVPVRARRALVAAVLAIGLAAVAGVAARVLSEDDPYRFHRIRIWSAALHGLAQSPWAGTGPGQFAAAAANLNFPNENTPLRFDRSFRTPHSDVLRAACEFGIPAALAALAAAACFATALWRRRARLTGIEHGAIAALGALAVQAVVDDLSTRPALTLLGASFAGFLVAVPREAAPGAADRVAARAAALLLVAALGAGEVAGFLAWDASHALPRGRLTAAQLDGLKRSIAWNPMVPDAWERLAEHAAGDGTSWDVLGYAAAREAAEHACRLQPVDAVYARGAARIEAAACLSILPFAATRDHAVRLYETAAALARTDATIPLEAARFLLRAGDPSGARRAAESALRLEPRAAVPRLWLAEAIAAAGGPGAAVEARRLLDEAIALAPPAGAIPTSPYDASLRWLDPALVSGLGRRLESASGP